MIEIVENLKKSIVVFSTVTALATEAEFGKKNQDYSGTPFATISASQPQKTSNIHIPERDNVRAYENSGPMYGIIRVGDVYHNIDFPLPRL